MKNKILFVALILFLLAASSVNAVTVDENSTYVTLGGRFNYTFLHSMNFTMTAVDTDRITLSWENISIIPNGTGFGNATINSWTTSMRNITVCSNNSNVNISFQNLTASTDLYIPAYTRWETYIENDKNTTVNATTSCKQFLIYDIYTKVTSSSAKYPSSKDANSINSVFGILNTGVNSAYSIIVVVILIIVVAFGIKAFNPISGNSETSASV